MKIETVEEDVKNKEKILSNLEGSLLYLKQDESKHEDAINLVSHEIFYLKDQLFNYHMLLNILRAENNDQMPKEV